MYIQIDTNYVETLVKFQNLICSCGGPYYQWYVGLTRDPEHSFTDIHKIDFNNTHWILSNKCSPAIMRYAKNILITLGCKFNKELDMRDSDRIYLYRKEIK
ncbi:MAG: hypothetical protein GY714_21635 [Desulfobacterales bacterium]|nr:hypothetical protein [Desulfobacterales bacterium]